MMQQSISEWKLKYPKKCNIQITNSGEIVIKKRPVSKARKKHEKENEYKRQIDQLNNMNNIYTKPINIPYHTKPKRLSKADEEQRQRMYELSKIENIGKRIYNRNMNHPDDFSSWRNNGIYIGTGANGVPVVKYGDYRVKHGGTGIRHVSLAEAEKIQKDRQRQNTHGLGKIEVVSFRSGAKEIEKIRHEAK